MFKGKAVESERHQVDAILDDDFRELIEHETLDEDAFLVEISMFFGSSHWCRSTPTAEHQSTPTTEHRLRPTDGTDQYHQMSTDNHYQLGTDQHPLKST